MKLRTEPFASETKVLSYKMCTTLGQCNLHTLSTDPIKYADFVLLQSETIHKVLDGWMDR